MSAPGAPGTNAPLAVRTCTCEERSTQTRYMLLYACLPIAVHELARIHVEVFGETPLCAWCFTFVLAWWQAHNLPWTQSCAEVRVRCTCVEVRKQRQRGVHVGTTGSPDNASTCCGELTLDTCGLLGPKARKHRAASAPGPRVRVASAGVGTHQLWARWRGLGAKSRWTDTRPYAQVFCMACERPARTNSDQGCPLCTVVYRCPGSHPMHPMQCVGIHCWLWHVKAVLIRRRR